MNFEKYADFVINFPILFIQNEDQYISGRKYIFKDFMEGKIQEIGNRLPTEADLTTHLSTIFTENRVKKYIELRSMGYLWLGLFMCRTSFQYRYALWKFR